MIALWPIGRSRSRRLEPGFLLIAAFVVLLLRPAPASGQTGEESRKAKPPAPRAPASRPRAEPVAPPVLTPTPAPAPPAPPAAIPASERKPLVAIEGAYFVEGTTGEIRVTNLSGHVFHVTSSDGWEGVGFLDGSIHRGVFRDGSGATGGVFGEQTIDWTDPEHPDMRAIYTIGRSGQLAQRWRRPDPGKASARPPAPPVQPKIVVAPPEGESTPGRRPAFGDYVYVEELPEAITKFGPVYPDEARRTGVDGVVMIQALVLEDGSVGDTRIVKSIPALDEAAAACVRQWHFKPALSAGRPVAVWVAVPIRFSLQ